MDDHGPRGRSSSSECLGGTKSNGELINSNTTTTPTSGRGAMAVNSPFGLVTVDDSKPNGSPKPLPTRNATERVTMSSS
eukprot:319672-Pleurochrysis_carterae.AAC.1